MSIIRSIKPGENGGKLVAHWLSNLVPFSPEWEKELRDQRELLDRIFSVRGNSEMNQFSSNPNMWKKNDVFNSKL